MISRRTFVMSVCAIAFGLLPLWAHADEPKIPMGFRAIFNAMDLTGWYGLNPHESQGLESEKKDANLAQQRAAFPNHWRVENGELVNDGHGPYATTEEEFGDFELLLEYKTVAGADSGIYLRGNPQVQIWDWNQPYDPTNPTRMPHMGSGGLFNNTPARLDEIHTFSLTSRSVSGINSRSARSGLRLGHAQRESCRRWRGDGELCGSIEAASGEGADHAANAWRRDSLA